MNPIKPNQINKIQRRKPFRLRRKFALQLAEVIQLFT